MTVVPVAVLRLRRRYCAHVANVWYLTPINAANCAPLIPLRSNSSSNASRRAAGVLTRPNASVFKIPSAAGVVFIVAPCYDAYDFTE